MSSNYPPGVTGSEDYFEDTEEQERLLSKSQLELIQAGGRMNVSPERFDVVCRMALASLRPAPQSEWRDKLETARGGLKVALEIAKLLPDPDKYEEGNTLLSLRETLGMALQETLPPPPKRV